MTNSVALWILLIGVISFSSYITIVLTNSYLVSMLNVSGVDGEKLTQSAKNIRRVLKSIAWAHDPCGVCSQNRFSIVKVYEMGIYVLCQNCGNSTENPYHVSLTVKGEEKEFHNYFNNYMRIAIELNKNPNINISKWFSEKYYWPKLIDGECKIEFNALGNSVSKALKVSKQL